MADNTQHSHLVGLNKEQKEAAVHIKGPLLIVAGAGAGKTKTITHRIVNLIKNGVMPEKILAVTFTNKAAKEMRERVALALGEEGARERTLGKRDGAGQRKFSAENFRGESAGAFETAPFISTFHSLGVYIIKENARLLGLNRHFTILDENDSISLIKEIIREIGLEPKQYDPKKIRNIISREKGKFTHLEDFAEKASDPLKKITTRVWNLYEKRKNKENSLDFDDLLLKTVKLLKENGEIRKFYQEKWEYLHIDEYQDTNEVQYLMSKLLSEKNRNICAVGDADQNIYSWRGANLKNILSFEKDYPDAKIILLEQNYRSTQNILEAANEVIRKNKFRPEKNLFTKNQAGEKIGFYEALDENDEADFVATKILEIIDSSKNFSSRGVSQADGPRGSTAPAGADSDPAKEEFSGLSQIAVLYRANFQSRALEEAMLRYNIPYQVVGVRFFERKEIKDTLAYVRAALNPESLADIKRIINFPARGIGKATLAKIFAGEKEKLPAKTQVKINNFYELLETIKEKVGALKASEIIKFVIKKSGIENELQGGGEDDLERLENIKELATLALKYDNLPAQTGLPNGAGIERLLEDASLASDQDDLMISQEKRKSEKEKNSVKLMTVHAAKGLEFRYVFVTGLEDGLFPHERQNERETAEDREEERRLFYVALTRAKEKIFLSFANFRTIFGARNINALSEFIADIPADLLEREGEKSAIKTIYI